MEWAKRKREETNKHRVCLFRIEKVTNIVAYFLERINHSLFKDDHESMMLLFTNLTSIA
jgi:hypothetical protein